TEYPRTETPQNLRRPVNAIHCVARRSTSPPYRRPVRQLTHIGVSPSLIIWRVTMSVIAPAPQDSRTSPFTNLLRRYQEYQEGRSWGACDLRAGWIDEVRNAPTVQESWIERHSH